MHIVVHDRLAQIDAAQWNRLLPDNNPFMRHEFLHGLEQCACVCDATGWHPQHIAIYAREDQQQLLAAMPCYIKDHSYGEYIFDWAWADAHQRHGLDYYPKLSNAVPFTPATGPRWLSSETDNETHLTQALLNKALEIVQQQNLSSVHSLFVNEVQAAALSKSEFSLRTSTQFHWHNQGYADFDAFLARMSSKKRKNIKRERRRVAEQDVHYRWLSGADLNPDNAAIMYAFYRRTINWYGAQSYLNQSFFEYLAESFAEQTLFLFAYYQDQVIAGGLYFRSDDTLYGRYWGALQNFHSVHFETCYYQAIQWCIDNGYQRFEAGAQGEHKLARGLEPSVTRSGHWIRHPQFRAAIDDFLVHEEEHIEHYQRSMHKHSPFKNEL